MSVHVHQQSNYPRFRDPVEKLYFLLGMAERRGFPKSALIILMSREALMRLRQQRAFMEMYDPRREMINGIDVETTFDERGGGISIDIVVKLGWADWYEDDDAPGPIDPAPREVFVFDDSPTRKRGKRMAIPPGTF